MSAWLIVSPHPESRTPNCTTRRLGVSAWLIVSPPGYMPRVADGEVERALRASSTADTERMGEPSKLMVVTAGGYGFEFSDGIAVVPITALGP